MEIQNMDTNAFADLFGGPNTQQQQSPGVKFGMEELSADILGDSTTTTEQTTAAPTTTTDQTTQVPLTTTEQTTLVPGEEEIKVEADILDGGKGPKTGKEAPKKAEIQGLSEYFQQRMKEGKLVAVNDVDEKGNKVAFIPKTAEDFDEVIQIQVDHRIEKAKEEINNQWYTAKSPAWKAIAQYAEYVDDPTQLIPFLQGVRTIQSVAQINENEVDGAEQIVRTRMEQRGDPEEVITQQIEALKTTGTLVNTAKAYKPVIVQQEQHYLAQQVQQRKAEEQEYNALVNDIAMKAYASLEQPIFGKQKLKKEEQALVYDLIGQPSEEHQGYALYTAIDKLFDNRDFETLKQVALLVGKKDSFYSYLGADIATKTATGLQRKLQAAAESHTGTANNYDEEKVQVVNRTQFNKKVRFGREQ
jgi:hypothetical protein